MKIEPGMIFRRKSDHVKCEVFSLSEGGSFLVMKNCLTGRRFNLSTWGLWRKYVWEVD